MNRLLTSLAAGLLALAIATPVVTATAAYAAPAAATAAAPEKGKGKGKRAGAMKKLEAVLPSLNLTAEQKPKVQEIIDKTKAELKEVQKAGGTPQEKRAKTKPIREAMTKKLMAILTPEQQTKLKEAMGRKGKGAKVAKKPATK